MRRGAAPLWLRRPGRYAGIARGRARAILAALAVAILLSWLSLAIGGGAPVVGDTGDAALHEGIVAGLRAGGGYYDVAVDQLRALGYPLRPFLALRLPTLAVVQATLPPLVVPVLMLAIAVSAGIVWIAMMMEQALRPPVALIAAAVLLAGGLVTFVQWQLWPLHALWAAPIVALSLAARRPGLWLTAVALGLAAVMIHEIAAVYLIVMAVLAWIEGDRREAAGWGVALGIVAAALVLHGWAASDATGPLDPHVAAMTLPEGPGLFIRGIVQSSALRLLPMVLAAPIVALSLFGWTAWAHPAALRVAATIAAYLAFVAVFARADTGDWALIAAPLLPAGLVFAPDGLRDLWTAAMDTRRVRVQRITR